MNYKVVRDGLGGLVCWGPNDDNYAPHVASGNTLTIEADIPPIPSPSIQNQIDALKAQVTSDKMRAAILDKGGVGKQALKDIDDQIDVLEAQLP